MSGAQEPKKRCSLNRFYSRFGLHRRSFVSFVALSLGLLFATHSWSASLNCAAASTRTEKAICSDDALHSSDDAMSHAYDGLYSALPTDQKAGLLADQRLWLSERDRNCGFQKTEDEFVNCLVRITRAREMFLSVVWAQPADGPKLQPQFYHDARAQVYQVSILYPRIESEHSSAEVAFNRLLHQLALTDKDKDWLKQENTFSIPNELLTTYEVKLATSRLISLTFTNYVYSGGVHGFTGRDAILYDLVAQRRLELGDALSVPSQAIPAISRFCAVQLRAQAAAGGWELFDNADLDKVVRDFHSWSVGLDGVDILFDAYSVAPGGAGAHECRLNYADLIQWLKRDGALAALAASFASSPSIVGRGPQAAPTAPVQQSQKKLVSTGTAFLINTNGDFVTNDHVVKECQTVRVRIAAARREAVAVASDEKNDLAVVRSAPIGVEPLRFREGRGIRAGDGVVALGFPYAGLLASSPQVTTGAVSALAGIGDDTRYLQLTAPVQPGNSGGPLMDMSGNVVGIVSARINALAVAEATGTLPENINFAIKSGTVREFLDANRIEYLTAPSTSKLDPADVGESGAKSTALVECYK